MRLRSVINISPSMARLRFQARFRMRLRSVINISVAILLCTTAFTIVVLRSRNNKTTALAKGAGQIQIGVVQLQAVAGIVPVEIRGEVIIKGSPYDEMRFAIKNNTNKAIGAITVAITSKAEANGKEFSGTAYMTKNQLIHPDIREIHHQKPIGPGEESFFGPEPLELQNGTTLKEITLNIDYVDFDDKSSLGPNEKGSVLINKVREGAAKYKEWLVQNYMKSAKSIDALIPVLKEPFLPKELGLGDHERTGANLYRTHLLMAYEQHGAEEVGKYLNR